MNKYPRLSVSGCTGTEEFDALKLRKVTEEQLADMGNTPSLKTRVLPLYVTFGTKSKYLVDVILDSDFCLGINFLGGGQYTLTLDKSETDSKVIDYKDTGLLLNFIRINE